MPINPIPGKGLEITLDEYNSLQVSLGGSDLWSFSNQQLLTKKFAPFLPRMEYNSANNSVVASMLISGVEVMGSSRPIPASPAAIPYESMAKLQNAIDTAKEEAAARVTDPNVRELIMAFSFPNPQEAPELYRLVGSENSPQLVLLWGLEKRGSQNIPLGSMQLDLHFQAMRKPLFTKKNMILGGAVAGAALLTTLFLRACCGGGDTPVAPPPQGLPTGAPPTQAPPAPQPPAGAPNQHGWIAGQDQRQQTVAPVQGSSPFSGQISSMSFRYANSATPDANGSYDVTFEFTTQAGPLTSGTATIAGCKVPVTKDSKAYFRMPAGTYSIDVQGTTANGRSYGMRFPSVTIPNPQQ